MPNAKKTVIHIKGLSIPALVGLHAPERESLQTVYIDIDCTLAEPEVFGEDLANSIDYAPIVEQIRSACVYRERRLVETLAREIADICFKHPHAAEVRVTVLKPKKLPGCEAVGVTTTFAR